MRRLLIIAIFFSLAVLGQGGAESQQPVQKFVPPITTHAKNSDQGNTETEQPQKSAINFPATVNLNVAGKLEVNTDTTKQHENAESAKWTDPLNISTLLLSLVTLGLVLLALKQLRATHKTTRAYVRISSCPPGIVFFDRAFPPPAVACKLEVKNYGETPTHITDIVIQGYISEPNQLLPYPPDFSAAKRYKCSDAFLVRGQSLFYQFYDETILNIVTIADIKAEKVILNLYGYVDYIDAFGKRHRGGFGQNYYAPYDNSKEYTSEDFPKRNNLTFLMQRGYNDDRERTKDEGNDWNYNQPFNPMRG